METTLQPIRPGWEQRLHAVLALLGGVPVPQVTARFGMGRSVLYKWRHRALHALQSALTDHRPGPQCPHNRLSPRLVKKLNASFLQRLRACHHPLNILISHSLCLILSRHRDPKG
jgi:hypothetical protein